MDTQTPYDKLAGIEEFVQDLQRRGYTKYASTQEVMVEFELDYTKAYYRVRKHWRPSTLKGSA